MRNYERYLRLFHLIDDQTGAEAWLRRQPLQMRTRAQMTSILDTEERGAENPMTEHDIAEFFMGKGYTYKKVFQMYSTSGNAPRNHEAISFHSTTDLKEKNYKNEPEGPAVSHVLWKEIDDEIAIESIAVDTEYYFRELVYNLMIDELKSFVLGAVGYKHRHKISVLLANPQQEQFWKNHAFKKVQMPENEIVMYWKPEFEA